MADQACSSAAASAATQQQNHGHGGLPWDKVRPYLKLLRKAAKNPSPSNTLPGGQFSSLTNPETFRKTMYKDLPEQELERLPKTLEDLLHDDNFVNDAPTIIPRAYERARKVLHNVKTKAFSKQGQTMDAETEKSLWPAIFCEGFAAELGAIMCESIQMRQAIQSRLSTPHEVASSKYSRMTMVKPEELDNLFDSSRARGWLPDWQTPGWDTLFAIDAARLFRYRNASKKESLRSKEAFNQVVRDPTTGSAGLLKASVIDVSKMAVSELKEKYPGLHAAYAKQMLIPFDLNQYSFEADDGARVNLRLCSLTEGCSHVVKLDWQPSSFDSQDLEEVSNNGFFVKDVLSLPLKSVSNKHSLLLESFVAVHAVSQMVSANSEGLSARWRSEDSSIHTEQIPTNSLLLFRSSKTALELSVNCYSSTAADATWFLLISSIQPSLK
eukprot:gb/GECG01010204.1/.p1 GENE.gb/GECG01010204.1/~~gb/GECG01010204.1/.p1  ORF type:complete len:440 (+),score=55.67 gb/GECG01010204.1/:1-1320(+)